MASSAERAKKSYWKDPERSRATKRAAQAKRCLSPEVREQRRKGTAKWRAKNPDKVKAYTKKNAERGISNWRRWRYGLPNEDFIAMLAEQGGLCAICGEFMNPPHVDHNHETGKVRGLLCFPCNAGIGMLKDNAERLLKAAAYIKGE